MTSLLKGHKTQTNKQTNKSCPNKSRVQYLCIIHGQVTCRGKKITCPGAWDKLNFRQDKHIFSPNVRRTSKKLNAIVYFSLTRTSYLVTGQVKILMDLPGGQVKIFRFFYPWPVYFSILELQWVTHGWSGGPRAGWTCICHPCCHLWSERAIWHSYLLLCGKENTF